MSEKTRIFRILKLITLLEGRHKKWSASDLAKFFGISLRTFHRDRELMEELKIPIYFDKELDSYNIMDTFRFTPPELTKDEGLALLLVGRASQEDNFPYQQELETGLAKILNSLPDSIRQVLEGIEDKISFQRDQGVDLSGYQEQIKEIEKAINRCNTIKINYYSLSSNKSRERKVDPYSITFKKGAGYLVGYCYLHHEIRLFRIDRIDDFEVLKRTFNRPEDYSLMKYFNNVWGVERGKEVQIELLISGFAAKYIKEYNWHSSQEIEELDDERIIFKVETGSLEEIKKWILGFGKDILVLEPESLKEEIMKEIEEMQENYRKTDVL